MLTEEKKASIHLSASERFDLEQKIEFLMYEFDGEEIYQPHRLQAKTITYAVWLLDHRWGIRGIIDDLAQLAMHDEISKKFPRTIGSLIRFFNEINTEVLIERR